MNEAAAVRITRRRVAARIVICLILAISAFWIGDSVGQRLMLRRASVELDSIQATLAFNRVQDERHWKSMLSKRCIVQLSMALDVSEDKDLELLAGILNGTADADAIRYVADRDPALVQQLKTFKSKYGRMWREEECEG